MKHIFCHIHLKRSEVVSILVEVECALLVFRKARLMSKTNFIQIASTIFPSLMGKSFDAVIELFMKPEGHFQGELESKVFLAITQCNMERFEANFDYFSNAVFGKIYDSDSCPEDASLFLEVLIKLSNSFILCFAAIGTRAHRLFLAHHALVISLISSASNLIVILKNFVETFYKLIFDGIAAVGLALQSEVRCSRKSCNHLDVSLAKKCNHLDLS